jgi:hypothetical protein
MAAARNPSPQEIIAGLVYFNTTELPTLRIDIDSIGPSLTNATNCMQRMHNVLTYLVRHCLQNVVMAAAAARAQAESSPETQKAEQEEAMKAILSAAASAPAGTAVPMPADVPGMTSYPIPQPAQMILTPAIRNVVVGRNDDATTRAVLGGSPANFEPEPGEVPFVIIGRDGTRVIPPKGSTAAPKTFAPGQPIDTTFAADQPVVDPGASG